MANELDSRNIETLLESLRYSKQALNDATNPFYALRQEKLYELEDCEKKLRRLRDEGKSG